MLAWWFGGFCRHVTLCLHHVLGQFREILKASVTFELLILEDDLTTAGAGDRLGLKCEVTGASIPTAMLPYCGRTLLEGLVRDLQVML